MLSPAPEPAAGDGVAASACTSTAGRSLSNRQTRRRVVDVDHASAGCLRSDSADWYQDCMAADGVRLALLKHVWVG